MILKRPALTSLAGVVLLLTIAPHSRAAEAWRSDPDVVDVSHGIGIPFGGIGTGFSVFGKFGFVMDNLDARSVAGYDIMDSTTYTREPADKAAFAFLLQEGEKTIALQENALAWNQKAMPVARVSAYANLPKGYFTFEQPGLDLGLTMTAFSPMVPHDLANSTIPIQIYDLAVENKSAKARTITVQLAQKDPMQVRGNISVVGNNRGEVAFSAREGKSTDQGVGVTLKLKGGESKIARFFIAWYYPTLDNVRVPAGYPAKSPKRYYTRDFANAAAVLAKSMPKAEKWSKQIDAWHAAYNIPACFKRVWFSSLCSVITSSLMSSDPWFLERETPHDCLNTMDVLAYSNWLYLINWPELEMMDMQQYLDSMKTEGPQVGLVWHSLWTDSADYMEEPIFLVRTWRDYLWYNDRPFLEKSFPHAVRAANRALQTGNMDYLINSLHGNQSYDCWKMPGISAYVNSPWVYGLYGLEEMSKRLGKPAIVGGIPAGEYGRKAAASYDKILWNETTKSWNLFFRTPGAKELSIPETLFSDQLFGKWMLLIDPGCEGVMPEEKVRQALQSVYANNLLDDPSHKFRGWTNGRLPGGGADLKSGHHSQVCWICAQLDLGSLMGDCGNEAAALDIFKSLESSLHNNHLAVGEWNQSVAANGKSQMEPCEPGKDSPRFPPYPRYKCSWEYLVRLVGLKMDEKNLYLKPFETLDFRLNGVQLAGMKLTIKVEAGWKRARVNGKETAGKVSLNRSMKECKVEFLK